MSYPQGQFGPPQPGGYPQQPAGYPPPHDQAPYGQQPYPGAPQWQTGAPPRRRRAWMVVVGTILVVWGAILTLAQLVSAAAGTLLKADAAPPYYMGYVGGVLVLIVLPLVGGIIMIVRSKPR
ncbi:MAG: DUF3824 domain-containing protein [Micrococcales bacterium]|nr:DUF3824 domain-containing protein [Micrococcales bacterium]